MESLLVVPKKKSDLKLIEDFLKTSSKVKSVKRIETSNQFVTKKRKEVPFCKISESSLAKDWLDKEDSRWDDLLK